MFAKNKIVVIVLLLSAIVLSACGAVAAQASTGQSFAGVGQQQTTENTPRTLSVNGTGQVRLSPDIAYVTIGVHTQNQDAKAAVEANNAQTMDLKDALVAFGVDADDIRTTNFNIYSFEDYSQPIEPGGEKPPLVYSVDNSVYVTVRDISTLGDLLSVAVDAGANNIWGIQFDVTDKAEAISQARELAVASARAQAEELAGYAEVELGEIVNISSYGGAPMPFAEGVGGGGFAAEAALDSSVPVSPGMLTITIDVSIVFEIE